MWSCCGSQNGKVLYFDRHDSHGVHLGIAAILHAGMDRKRILKFLSFDELLTWDQRPKALAT